jgi:hypothetical protein
VRQLPERTVLFPSLRLKLFNHSCIFATLFSSEHILRYHAFNSVFFRLNVLLSASIGSREIAFFLIDECDD